MNFSKKISELENNHLLRSRRVSNSPQTTRMVIDGSEVVNFCSNDYLSLASHPKVKEAFIKGVEKYGSGSGASHLVSGHSESHKLLEEPYQNLLGKRMLSYSHLDIVLILEFFQRSETKLSGHYKTS